MPFPWPFNLVCCTCRRITSLPATISSPGVYCLTRNLTTGQTTGNAITINANDVVLDLNGWTLDGSAAGTATTAIGIYGTGGHITIRNGTVRGFNQGIFLLSTGGQIPGGKIQGIIADKNTERGIAASGPGCLVEGNKVVATGGSTRAANVGATGINAGGEGGLVVGNLVSGLTATGGSDEIGISLAFQDSTARDNVVNDRDRPAGGGHSIGILAGTVNSAVVNNIVTNFTFGVSYSGGGGTYSRNTVIGCDTPYSGGTAGSGND